MRRPQLLVGALLLGAWILGSAGCDGCRGGASPGPSGTDAAAPVGEADAAPGASAQPSSGVRLCCLALGRNVVGAPAEHRAAWQAAFDACNRAAEQDAGRESLAEVREKLEDLGWPAACQ